MKLETSDALSTAHPVNNLKDTAQGIHHWAAHVFGPWEMPRPVSLVPELCPAPCYHCPIPKPAHYPPVFMYNPHTRKPNPPLIP